MKFSSSKHSKKIWLNRAVSAEMVVCYSLIAITLFIPKTVEAGLFSSFYDIGTAEVYAKAAEGQVVTSQNMTVLKAAVNVDPNPSKSLAEAPRTSGNALVAQIGPSGSIEEIKDDVNTQISIYVVREGDSLSDIADMFDVSVNTIIWANNLGSKPVLKEGQTLVILPISGIRYTVKRGDTIKGIVGKYKADLDDVLRYNNMTLETVLKEGDIVMIPDAEPVQQSALAKKVGTKASSIQNPVHDADGPSYPGYYTRPVRSGTKTQGLHGYNAVDIGAAEGSFVYAAAEGTVIASKTGGWNGGYGNYVIISHPNGTQTLYAHNSKNLVDQGQTVEQGQAIARVGETGHATGPHVHFEIRGAKNPF